MKKIENILLLIVSVVSLVLGLLLITSILSVEDKMIIDSVVYGWILLALGTFSLIVSIHGIIKNCK